MTDSRTPDRAAIVRHRWRLAIPLALAVLLLGGYVVLWFQGARIMRAEIAEWVAGETDEGRSATHGAIRIRGFPGTLRAEIDAPAWSDPGVWAWSAETLFVITQPLNPRRLLLTPRGEQRLEHEGRTYDFRAGDLRVALAEGLLAVEAADLSAESGGQSLDLGAMRANWRENEDGSAVLGLSLAQALYAEGGDEYWLPQLNAVLSEGVASDLGIDAFEGAIATSREAPPAFFAGEGRLAVGEDGYPEGRLDVTLRDADELAAVLIQSGALDRGRAGMATALLGGFDDGEGGARLPFVFVDGKAKLGPIPIGDLPRL